MLAEVIKYGQSERGYVTAASVASQARSYSHKVYLVFKGTCCVIVVKVCVLKWSVRCNGTVARCTSISRVSDTW